MVDGMGFLRPCLDGSRVFTDVQNDGIFRPNRTKSSSTSLKNMCLFVVFVKVVFSSHGERKRKGMMVFVACEKHPMFLVLLFFVAGVFIP